MWLIESAWYCFWYCLRSSDPKRILYRFKFCTKNWILACMSKLIWKNFWLRNLSLNTSNNIPSYSDKWTDIQNRSLFLSLLPNDIVTSLKIPPFLPILWLLSPGVCRGLLNFYGFMDSQSVIFNSLIYEFVSFTISPFLCSWLPWSCVSDVDPVFYSGTDIVYWLCSNSSTPWWEWRQVV